MTRSHYRACDKLVNSEPGAEKLEFIPLPGSWFPAHQFSDRVIDHTPPHPIQSKRIASRGSCNLYAGSHICKCLASACGWL